MKAFVKAVVICSVSILLTACDKSLLDVDFTYTAKSMEFLIDSTQDGKSFALDTILINNSNFDSVITANKAKRSDIQSIKVKSVSITLDSGRNDIFRSVDGFLMIDGPEEKQIVHADYGPTLTSNVNAIVYDVELLTYISKPTMKFRAAAVAGINSKEASKVKITIKYLIKAKI